MSKFPVCVVMYLTDYCDLKCKHCFLTQTKCLNKNMLDYKYIKKVLKELKENNVFMVAYTGGDPMLHPDIFKILRYTSKLGMLPLLGVSGINIDYDKAKKIYKSGVRCVQIGLNGSTEELNDYYRGTGSYKEALISIDNLMKCNINVNLSFCLDKHNVYDLKNMLNFAEGKGIYKVKVEFWDCIDSKNNNNIEELTDSEKDQVRTICDDKMKEVNKKDWIQYPKASSSLTKIHSKALIIMPDGSVKKQELGAKLGSIYDNDIKDMLEVEMKKEEDYFFENYRMADFYDDYYGRNVGDISFWVDQCKDKKSILEVACGTGRITIPIIESGKKVFALDYSQAMLDILKEKADVKGYNEDNIEIFCQDMRDMKFDKKFDIILITSNSVNHLEKTEDFERMLNSVYGLLEDKGLLIFDALKPRFKYLMRNMDEYYDEDEFVLAKTGEKIKICENSKYDHATQINNVNYYYTDSKGKKTTLNTKVRLYFPQELDYIISKSKFEVVGKYDWYDFRPFRGKTNEQIFILRK